MTRCELHCRQDLILGRIGASHFLWKMVRRLVGVLVEIGKGSLPPERILELIKERGPGIGRWTAPPSGLFLEQVRYEGDSAPGPLVTAVFSRC